MDLICQVVKNTNVVAGGQQGVSKVRAHKPCSAGDEYVFAIPYLAPIRDVICPFLVPLRTCARPRPRTRQNLPLALAD